MLKRKVRYALLVILMFGAITLVVDTVMKFQLNKKVDYYLKFFDKSKDAIDHMYDPLNIKQIPASAISELYEKRLSEKAPVEWDNYAYVNYVTDFDYLCNTFLQFQQLHNSGSEANLVALVSDDLLERSNQKDEIQALLDKIRAISDKVIIKEIKLVVQPKDHTPWSKSLTKLAIFNLTEYERIIYMDNDAILHDHMDELFFLPSYIKFAAPISYWFINPEELRAASNDIKRLYKKNKLEPIEKKLQSRIKNSLEIYNHLPNLPQHLYSKSMNFIIDIDGFQKSDNKVKFATHLMVIRPDSEIALEITDNLMPKYLNRKELYDTDLINDELYNFKELIYYQFKLFNKIQTLFKPSVLVLPYTKYGLLSGSIDDHRQAELLKNGIIGYQKEENDSIEDAKFIHFSDYPLSKPWYYTSADDLQCSSKTVGDEKCQYWKKLYSDYLEARRTCDVK